MFEIASCTLAASVGSDPARLCSSIALQKRAYSLLGRRAKNPNLRAAIILVSGALDVATAGTERQCSVVAT